MELVHELSFTAMLKPPLDVGAGPHGPRMYAEVICGELVGDGLEGKVLSGGGDWLVLAPAPTATPTSTCGPVPDR